ncbi:MAG: GNAT family N-acetyltransferase, partial [Pseudomonadota bacterium]
MSPAEISLARRRDAPRLAAMSRRLVEAGLEPSWTAERIERHVAHDDSVAIVAKLRGETVGFAIMQFGDTTAHLNLLAVEPRVRRAGVGRALVAWLEESARVAGTFTVDLELRAHNAVAERPAGCGFGVVGCPSRPGGRESRDEGER